MKSLASLQLLLPLGFLLGACTPAPSPSPDAARGDASTAGEGGSSAEGGATATPTWWRDVLPLMQTRCVQCHTAGGIGPFPLDTYERASGTADLIVAETAAGTMPPWMPADGCRSLQGSQRLTDAEKAMLAAWSSAGAPEGNQADYRAPMLDPATRALPPSSSADLVVQPAGTYTPSSTGTDDYHCFVLDPNLSASRDVVGFRVVPNNPAIVHHVILFEVRAESLAELQRLDDAEPGPGYTCFGLSGVNTRISSVPAESGEVVSVNTQWVGSWAPGAVPVYLPEGTGIRIHAGSRLVMQVHYNLTGATRGMTDRSRVELYYSPQPVSSVGFWYPMVEQGFSVPPGARPTDPMASVLHTEQVMLPVRVLGVAPHMHLRGSSISIGYRRSGTDACFVNVPRWNFHWQQGYWLQRPQQMNLGSDTLTMRCSWDNTPANQPFVDGVQQPPHTLTWGEGTNDEMCLGLLYIAL